MLHFYTPWKIKNPDVFRGSGTGVLSENQLNQSITFHSFYEMARLA